MENEQNEDIQDSELEQIYEEAWQGEALSDEEIDSLVSDFNDSV